MTLLFNSPLNYIMCCNKKDICVTELIYPMHGMWMLQRSIFKRNIYKCTKRELEVVNKR